MRHFCFHLTLHSKAIRLANQSTPTHISSTRCFVMMEGWYCCSIDNCQLQMLCWMMNIRYRQIFYRGPCLRYFFAICWKVMLTRFVSNPVSDINCNKQHCLAPQRSCTFIIRHKCYWSRWQFSNKQRHMSQALLFAHLSHKRNIEQASFDWNNYLLNTTLKRTEQATEQNK